MDVFFLSVITKNLHEIQRFKTFVFIFLLLQFWQKTIARFPSLPASVFDVRKNEVSLASVSPLWILGFWQGWQNFQSKCKFLFFGNLFFSNLLFQRIINGTETSPGLFQFLTKLVSRENQRNGNSGLAFNYITSLVRDFRHLFFHP